MSQTEVKKFPLTAATIARIKRRSLLNKNELNNLNNSYEIENEYESNFNNFEPIHIDSKSSQISISKQRNFSSEDCWR